MAQMGSATWNLLLTAHGMCGHLKWSTYGDNISKNYSYCTGWVNSPSGSCDLMYLCHIAGQISPMLHARVVKSMHLSHRQHVNMRMQITPRSPQIVVLVEGPSPGMQRVLFSPPLPTKMLVTDTFTLCWRAHLDHLQIQGLWTPKELSLYINVLELRAVNLACAVFSYYADWQFRKWQTIQ